MATVLRAFGGESRHQRPFFVPIKCGAWGKCGALDCVWDSALQNTLKNARRMGTHPDGWRYKPVASWLCGPQYVWRAVVATVKRPKSTVHPVMVR